MTPHGTSSTFLTAASFAVLLAAGCHKAETKPAVVKTAAAPKLEFNQDIQPILAENCYSCHGPDPGSRKAGLRLDRAEFAFAKHEKSGPAIVAGRPDESPLIRRVESKDEKERMPPKDAHKTLAPDAVALLRRWVAEGAPYQEHWAFIPPTLPTPPMVPAASSGLVRNDVDRFIFARLAKEHLEPAPEADRPTLIRRVTLDLIGLPPTPEAVAAFVADTSPGAYERVVDRLLASPRFGEHRAHYWLDAVRYADTHGIHFDNYRAIWPYRDYVVRAYNENLPFDQFIRQQLAGDLLPAKKWDELVATGFMRSNLTTNEGGDIPEETYVNQTRDRVETFGVAFLGLTTGCAACHDHKFDPFTQKDFYGLAAYLNNTAEPSWDSNAADPAPVVRLPRDEDRTAAEVVLARRAELQKQLDEHRATGRERLKAFLLAGHAPKPVDPAGLELRLKLDEGSGDKVKNSAPHAAVPEYTANTNPLVWGENSWFWPSMRMDILSRLPLGSAGDVDAGDSFSAGGWLMLRAKPGGAGGVGTTTGDGAWLARMGMADRKGGAGWEIYYEKGRFVVNLVPAPAPAKSPALSPMKPVATKTGAVAAPMAKAVIHPLTGLSVQTTDAYPRNEWLHVFFTYDGSRKAKGLKIYVNGVPAKTEIVANALTANQSIRTDAVMQLGRRDDALPLREARYQDVRFYRRLLSDDEVSRLTDEDVAAEIVARSPNPAKWTTDEAFVVVDRWFLGQADAESIKLTEAVKAHTNALDALTKDGVPSLIAVERPTPAYADLLKRGDYYSRVGRVGPATPHFLPPLPVGAPVNRRGLAEWLLSPEQPLFTRVTVNRMWQEIFGTGLVDTAGDFGVMGSKPSHPELLDWLAVSFREGGWNVKGFYRILVTSATYRQSAVSPEDQAKDPGNRLLGRGPRFRMDAEMLRDSALAVSGLLVDKLGGPPAKPYQPPGLWEAVAMPESNTKNYVADHGEGLYRRSVYTFRKRGSMPPSLETFDAVSRETVCPRRVRTNTPLQAFVTMNDPQWFEAARQLAQRTMLARSGTADRLQYLAQLCLSRPLEPREVTVFAAGREKFAAYFAGDADAAHEVLAVGESPVNAALNPAELAEWTMTASQFLNLDEFLTK